MESGPPAQPDAGPSAFVHQPVLASEVLQAFRHLPTGPGRDRSPCLIDCTLGGGGHSALLLAAHPDLDLIGLDQDPSARAAAAETLAPFGQRVQIMAANFADFLPQSPVQGVLADLGVSSPQLDWAERGFSFRADGPLDMRMNPESDRTAALLIEQLSETELSDLLFHCGEERLARRIARRIKTHLLEQGPFSGTAALAHLIRGCYPPQMRRGRIHPATRTFQALRIAVNRELEALDRLLTVAPDWLSPGGILAIISFHSLEDRRVKQAFLTDERLERIERKAIQAGVVEQSANPRSRSARLRLARRRAHGN